MSKKIKLLINNKHSILGSLFHQYLERKSSEYKNFNGTVLYDEDDYEDIYAYWDRIYPGWDDEISDDGECMFPKRNTKHKHKRGKKGKCIDITTPYSGYEGDLDNEDDYEYTSKLIWYYPDYHDKEDRLEFNSYNDFEEYCLGMGYKIPDYVKSDLEYRFESHCCLNSLSLKDGILEIMSEHSYGEMFYECCDVSELSNVL